MIKSIEFNPPINCSKKEADEVMRYMELYYRMEDVLDLSHNIAGFRFLDEEKQRHLIERIAARANGIIDDYNEDYHDAIMTAIEKESTRSFCEEFHLSLSNIKKLDELYNSLDKEEQQQMDDIIGDLGIGEELDDFYEMFSSVDQAVETTEFTPLKVEYKDGDDLFNKVVDCVRN